MWDDLDDIDAYQREACRTVNRDLAPDMRLATAAMGLANEAGEAGGIVRKHLEQGHTLDTAKLSAELGDVLWYVATLADAVGLTLSDVARGNVEKLRKRYPDGGFSEEASRNRGPSVSIEFEVGERPRIIATGTDQDKPILDAMMRAAGFRLSEADTPPDLRGLAQREIASEAVQRASRPMCDNCGASLSGRWGMGHLCAECLGATPLRQPRCRCGKAIEVGVAHCQGCAP